uniref:Uncharacterized protein n=1 Tax=Glossina brevipalpis TaxID=37001 RepID=A0A1A9WW39_9MUSC
MQLKHHINTLKTFSNDISMQFGLSICSTLLIHRGKLKEKQLRLTKGDVLEAMLEHEAMSIICSQCFPASSSQTDLHPHNSTNRRRLGSGGDGPFAAKFFTLSGIKLAVTKLKELDDGWSEINLAFKELMSTSDSTVETELKSPTSFKYNHYNIKFSKVVMKNSHPFEICLQLFIVTILNITPARKLWHLRNKIRGTAGVIVKRYLLCHDNLLLTWEALKSQYGNKRALVENQVRTLFDFLTISEESIPSIIGIKVCVNECPANLRALNVSVSNWDPVLVYLIWIKLLEGRFHVALAINNVYYGYINDSPENNFLLYFKVMLSRVHQYYLVITTRTFTNASTRCDWNFPIMVDIN